MAIEGFGEKKVAKDQKLKIVSVRDSAIDWDESYKGEIDDIEVKQQEYAKNHDLSKIVFLEGVEPWYFIFEHPLRIDIKSRINGIYSKDKDKEKDVFREILNIAYLGYEVGLDGTLVEVPRRAANIEGKRVITEEAMQALSDSVVFEEISMAFFSILNTKPKIEVSKKKY